MKRHLLLFFFIFLAVLHSNATINNWLGTSTDWNDAANWSKSQVPDSTDSVVIPGGLSVYPFLAGSLFVSTHDTTDYYSTFDASFKYFCGSLSIEVGASLNFGGAAKVIESYYSFIEVHGTLNFPGGILYSTFGYIAFDEAHVILGSIITTYFIGSELTITNSYVEAYFDTHTAGFTATNSTLVGTLIGSATFSQCKWKLKKNDVFSDYWQSFDAGSGQWEIDIENFSPADDTVYIALSGNKLKGSLNFNTDNDCGVMMVQSGFFNMGPSDTALIKGDVKIGNKGIIEFPDPVVIEGVLTSNHGHILKTYPGAINIFPPGDTLFCPIDLHRSTLDLSGGKLYITDTLKADTIVNADNDHYIVTNPNGRLVKFVNNDAAPVSFSVGTNSSYAPASFVNHGAEGDNFSVNIKEGVLSNGTTGFLFTTDVVNCTWDIHKEIPGTGNTDITLQWNAEDELPGFERDSCSVSHYMNNAWLSSLYSKATGTGPYSQTFTGINSFSPFSVGSRGVIPLKCNSFKATVSNTNDILLTWEINSALLPEQFILQRSNDGTHFNNLAQIDADDYGQSKRFSYTDKTSTPGINFYRLLQIDLRGRQTQLCNVVKTATNVKANDILLKGNPAYNYAVFIINSQAMQKIYMQLVSIDGRQISTLQFKAEKGISDININIKDLLPGIYLAYFKGEKMDKKILFIKK